MTTLEEINTNIYILVHNMIKPNITSNQFQEMEEVLNDLIAQRISYRKHSTYNYWPL